MVCGVKSVDIRSCLTVVCKLLFAELYLHSLHFSQTCHTVIKNVCELEDINQKMVISSKVAITVTYCSYTLLLVEK